MINSAPPLSALTVPIGENSTNGPNPDVTSKSAKRTEKPRDRFQSMNLATSSEHLEDVTNDNLLHYLHVVHLPVELAVECALSNPICRLAV